MVERKQVVAPGEQSPGAEAVPKEARNSYFATPRREGVLSSGCMLLDCILGGGWGLGRIANIVGDKSAGKTLLAIEACAAFAARFPAGRICYAEAEAAFDLPYAEALGLPVDRVLFAEEEYGLIDTVEGFFSLLNAEIEKGAGQEKLVILDSLDALSDAAEMKRELTDGTYGASKAKQLSQMFRRLVRSMSGSKLTLLIVSQVRDNIGVTFGTKYSRSGGRALDFYCSQVVYLAHIGYIKKKRQNIERAIGINVKAKVTKNKIGLPFRDCEFPVHFGFGVESVAAGLAWCIDVNKHKDLGFATKEEATKFLKGLASVSQTEYDALEDELLSVVPAAWSEIEQGFLPARQKNRGR